MLILIIYITLFFNTGWHLFHIYSFHLKHFSMSYASQTIWPASNLSHPYPSESTPTGRKVMQSNVSDEKMKIHSPLLLLKIELQPPSSPSAVDLVIPQHTWV
jgi:hypothetical protein